MISKIKRMHCWSNGSDFLVPLINRMFRINRSIWLIYARIRLIKKEKPAGVLSNIPWQASFINLCRRFHTAPAVSVYRSLAQQMNA